MYMLFDFKCSDCEHVFEDLVDSHDEDAKSPCSVCGAFAGKIAGLPTRTHNPKQAEMQHKAANMYNKVTGKVPWRKNSESQTD